MIEIKNLYKRYHNHHGSKWVLKDISLTIPKGVSVGLVGQNGAGKSTLLKLIGDMDTPDKGQIVRHCAVSWPIGLSGGFQPGLTGRQNVKFVARIHGHESLVKQTVAFVEDFAELGDSFDEPVRTYSSGMRSRLAFGLSLAFDFDVYLSDEATAVGDAIFKQKASQAFKDRVGQASLIMVSHSEGILRELCQAGIWLHEGHATWFDDINDALNAYKNFREQKAKQEDSNKSHDSEVEQKSTSATQQALPQISARLGRIAPNGQRIFGWACSRDPAQRPVSLTLYINNQQVETFEAIQPRKDMIEKFGHPCGFVYQLNKQAQPKPGDKVDVKFTKNQKSIANSPLIYQPERKNLKS